MFLQGHYTSDITQVNKWIFGLAQVKEIPAHIRSQSTALPVVDDLQGTHWEIFKVLHIRPTIAATCRFGEHTFICTKRGKTYLRTTRYVLALKRPFCSVVERDQKATGEFCSKVTEHWATMQTEERSYSSKRISILLNPFFFSDCTFGWSAHWRFMLKECALFFACALFSCDCMHMAALLWLFMFILTVEPNRG